MPTGGRCTLPRIGRFQERLDTLLTENEARPRRERLRMTRIHDLLLREGFDGSYDAVRRYAKRWLDDRRKDAGDGAAAFIPLMFRPGEAYQFDWSHEDVEIAGKPMRVKVAHMRLCASRAVFVRAYPRETQEMVFDAHARAFAFFGGVPTRGIYDNMKTVVTTVFTGKERVFNRRFLIMADHYMIEPTACSPAAGWEEGQVEHQVQTIRGRFFQPQLRFASLEELNGRLEAECRRWAALHPHPDQRELTIAEAWDAERPSLQVMLAPFDGFHETPHAVTGTCLISFDRNRYSVMAKAARRAVQVRAYADRIVVRLDDEVIAEHRLHNRHRRPSSRARQDHRSRRSNSSDPRACLENAYRRRFRRASGRPGIRPKAIPWTRQTLRPHAQVPCSDDGPAFPRGSCCS